MRDSWEERCELDQRRIAPLKGRGGKNVPFAGFLSQPIEKKAKTGFAAENPSYPVGVGWHGARGAGDVGSIAAKRFLLLRKIASRLAAEQHWCGLDAYYVRNKPMISFNKVIQCDLVATPWVP
ncbi:hypothetical protein [Mesorhizobium retamae]|uniref:Uncharacterized protein n=1 Tax=Mesorhizobium retamae TaxID=2912854 RepID=A0ABS9QGN4_9HYPH|nr:hypothetical protein [Mesorhizobium sp. IRAMC:0171]MCG7506591.1 hypothetical protein [Mesorhizobium sp. IRAMC:0171]